VKRLIISTIFAVGFLSLLSAQEVIRYEKPLVMLSSEKGYIMINEINMGFGLGVNNVPYSQYFIGLNTIHAYQINQNYVVGGGTGVSFYNGGTLVPLFLDFRYRIYVSRVTPYAVADAGFMLDFSGKKDTRGFINPSVGVSYTLKPQLAISAGTGMFIQWGHVRDTFINLKGGVVYKF
jgi:hypothetical protein